MARSSTLRFNFAAWLTLFVFVGAAVFLPRRESLGSPDQGPAQNQSIRQASSLPSALVSTHTFVAKPISVSAPASGVDLPLFSSAPRQQLIAAGNFRAQRTVALHGARHARPTLVGVVEFRL